MNFTFKRALLTSTAIVAVASFASTAQAANLTLTASDLWADGGGADAGPAVAGDNINIATFDLTISNDGTADDNGGIDLFTVGAITGTTGDVIIASDVNNVGANDLNVDITSITLTGAASNVSISNQNTDDASVDVDISGALDIVGNLSVVNNETTTGDDVSLTIGGNADVDGTTTISGGTGAFSNTAAVTVEGNAVFGGAVAVNGGADASSTATLTLNGNATFTAGLTLTDGVAGEAHLDLLGLTGAQTVTGNIGGTGTITVQNADGVTFNGTVTGQVVAIENGAGALNSQATFTNTVAAAITLGAAGTGTNTATFDTTGGSFGLTGAISGGAAGETNNIRVTGGNTFTLNTASTANLDNLLVTGNSTMTTGQNVTLTGTATVNSGSTLITTGNTLTTAIANSGTLNLNGGSVIGAITGAGSTNVNSNGSITGNIAQTLITVDDSADLTIVGAAARTVTADIVLDDAASNGTDAELIFDNGANTTTFTGDITVDIDGEGIVTFANDAGAVLNVVGDIGTSDTQVGTLTVAGAGAQTFTTTGNLYVDAINVDDADTIQFLGDGVDQVVSGAVTGGILIVGNGTTATSVAFDGALASMVTGAVGAGAAVDFGANATFASTYTNAGETTVGRGATVSTTNVVDGTAGTFNIEVGKTAGTQTNGVITESADNADYSNDTIHFVVNSLQPLTTGASVLNNVFIGNAQNVIAGATVTDNSYLYGFTLVDNVNNVDVTVAQENTIDSAATNSAHASIGNALLTDLSTSTDADINGVQAQLVSAGTAEEVNDVLESVAPSIDGSVIVTGLDVSSQSLGLNSTRLASLRTGQESGMTAGEIGKGMTVWTQAFGQLANQDTRDGVDGYEADTMGLAVGLDSENVADNVTVGAALSYANTDIEADNINSTDTDIDSFQVSLYGDYDLDKDTYVEGMLAYAHNNIEQDRHNVGLTANTASADYDSGQYIAYAEVGRDYAIAEKTTLTPSVLAHYQHINVDDYSETGAGGLNLDVDSQDFDIFELGLGAELGWDLNTDDGGVVRPAVNVGYRYDLIGDDVQSTSSFTGSGVSFDTNGLEPARSTFNVGASVTFATSNNWEFTADYDFEYKSDYDAHSGYVRAGYKF